MTKIWKDLPVGKKLFAVVGLMAVLIALELFALVFAMKTLSAVRATVQGEGLWSRAQKTAILSLYRYVLTKDEANYQSFMASLEIPFGDRQARLALAQEPLDLETARRGFAKGGNHQEDIDQMIGLLRRFRLSPHIQEALNAWTEADAKMDELIAVAAELHARIQGGARQTDKIGPILQQVDQIDRDLTALEIQFSNSLGEGSRWLEKFLLILMFLTVLVVEGSGLFLTIMFSRHLSESLKEIRDVARAVGEGNFSARAKVSSQDELGQLAEAVNKMSNDLRTQIFGREQAENANRAKSIFLASTSHEIRSPLGIILGFADLLNSSNLTEIQRAQYLSIIQKTGRDLSRVIDDILEISKVESGHLKIERTDFDLHMFMNDLKDLFEVKVKENQNQIFFVSESPDCLLQVNTDRIRLQQILINMITNANKFTHNGRIEVRFGLRESQIYFRIIDTGIGIHPKEQDQLFQLFSRVERSAEGSFGGTGLGLVLSKRIAESLGGDVLLERSEVGKGSTFMVTVATSYRVMTQVLS